MNVWMVSQKINGMNWRISGLEKRSKPCKVSKQRNLEGNGVVLIGPGRGGLAGYPNGMGLVGHMVDQGGAQHELEAEEEALGWPFIR